MQIYIQDRSESTVATIGDFYEDMHKTLTSTGTGSYEFTVSKSEPGQEFLNVGNYVVLLDEQNKGHQFTITKVDQLHDEKTVYAEDASLQLLSKEARPWAKLAKAQPASYYFNKALEGTGWVIGVNQIANLTRTLEWTGWDTVLTRLLSIATEFDNAELDFHVELDRTNVVRKVVDIYKQVGAYRDDIQLVYGDTANDIQKTESTENFATAIEGIGSLVENTKEGEPEKHYDFSAIGYDDGDFYSPKGDPKLYSRKAHEKWDGKYGYSERHFEYETKDPQELLNRSKTELKKRCEPEVNYEISIADGRLIDINKGDTVKIFDHTYNPELLLQARAVEVDKSYTDPSQNKAIFGNFLTLISNVDPRILAIQKQISQLPKARTPYPWVRYADDDQGNGISAFPKGKLYMATVWSYETAVPSDNPIDYASKWIKVKGEDGQDGSNGVPGPKGSDGQTSYFHTAWADNISGTTGFTTSGGDGKTYIGTYSDLTKADSEDPSKYNWALFKGEDGKDGRTPIKGTDYFDGKDGQDGKSSYLWIRYSANSDGTDMTSDPTGAKYVGYATTQTNSEPTLASAYKWQLVAGKDGIAGEKGTDGKTSFLHIRYSNDGGKTFTANSGETVGTYIGQYTDFTQSDSNNVSDYKWALIKGDKGPKGNPGNQGIPGTPGVDGRTPYTHWAYANSADGTLDFNPDYKSAVGLDVLNIINWVKNTSMSNSTYKFNSNADSSFKVNGRGTSGYEVLSKSFPAKIGDKLRFTVRYTNRLAFGLFAGYGLQFVVSSEYTESVTSTSKIVLPNAITTSTEYQLEYTATTNNVWMQLNFGGIADRSQVDFDVKIEVENITNPVKYAYMGTYSDYTATDSTVPTDYKWSRILGEDGADGIAGKDGIGIKSTTVTYQASTSGTTQPTGTWSVTVPSTTKGQYLWTRTVWTYTDNTTETGYSVSYIAKDGNNGTNGIAGKDGVGIKSTTITYANSTSGTTAPTSGWASSVPTVPAGEFLWTKTIWAYSDNTTETGFSVAKMGADGTGHLATWNFYKLSNSTTPPQVVPIGASTNIGHLGPNNTWNPLIVLNAGSGGWATIDFDKIEKSDIIPDKPFTWYLEASFDGVSNFNGSTDFNIIFENWYANSAGSSFYDPLGTLNFTASKFSPTNDTIVNNYFIQSVSWTVPRAVYDAIPDGGFLNLRIRIDRFTKLYYHAKNSYVTYGTIPSNRTQLGLGNYSTYGWKPNPETVTQSLPYLWTYQIQFYDNGKEIAIPPAIIGAHGLKGDPGSKDVPVTTVSAAQPATAKNGDIWWVLNSADVATAMKVYTSGAWVDKKVDQSVLNIVTLNAVEINGSTINGSEFNTSYTGTLVDGLQGSSQQTLDNTGYSQTSTFPRWDGSQIVTRSEINNTGGIVMGYSPQAKYNPSKPWDNTVGQINIDPINLYIGFTATGLSGDYYLSVQDAYQNSGSATYLNGWGSWNADYSLKVVRQGRMVTVWGYIKHNNSATITPFAQVPAWARPEQGILISAVTFNSKVDNPIASALVMNAETGRIGFNSGGQKGGYVCFSTTYVGGLI